MTWSSISLQNTASTLMEQLIFFDYHTVNYNYNFIWLFNMNIIFI